MANSLLLKICNYFADVVNHRQTKVTSETHPLYCLFIQVIFKRYDVDNSGTIKSFDMRNAVEDAGQASSKGNLIRTCHDLPLT